jgi:hypothetical protein
MTTFTFVCRPPRDVAKLAQLQSQCLLPQRFAEAAYGVAGMCLNRPGMSFAPPF